MSRKETPLMLCMYSSRVTPSPIPPALALQLVIQCQPFKIILQKAMCLRIALLFAESVVWESAMKLLDRALHAAYVTLKEFDLNIPVNGPLMDEADRRGPFTSIRIHISGFTMANSPFLSFRVLNLDNDPACSSIWKGQPAESNHQRWEFRASNATITLETENVDDSAQRSASTETDWAAKLWYCVEMSDLGVEAALLICEMSKSITHKQKEVNFGEKSAKKLLNMVPADMRVVLSVNSLEFRLLAIGPNRVNKDCPTLAKLLCWEIVSSVSHKKLTGVAMVNSKLVWQDIRIECAASDSFVFQIEIPSMQGPKKHVSSGHSISRSTNSSIMSSTSSSRASSTEKQRLNGVGKDPPEDPRFEELTRCASASYNFYPVIWIGKERGSMKPVERKVEENEVYSSSVTPFLDINVGTLVPYDRQDTDSCKLQVIGKIGGVRLGGSMCQVESLL